jgi:mannose-6-phosphate isomerase-like protein (cupin superfamily)
VPRVPGVTVVDSNAVPLRAASVSGLSVRPTVGPHTDFPALAQAVLECQPGYAGPISIGDVEETLFVLSGQGTITADGHSHALEPEVGVYLAPGSQFELHNRGPQPLRLIAVRIPDPAPEQDNGPRAAVRTLADQEQQPATAQREFRIVADPDCGLRSATHFVGYIPTVRAPDHFHTYDEVIYVLDGEGVMHAGELNQPLRAGSCIQLPARTVHCLENTGAEPMRVVAVFRPAGSPAAAYYPDGTPAYASDNQQQLQRRVQQQ